MASSEEIKILEDWVCQNEDHRTYFANSKSNFAIASMFVDTMETNKIDTPIPLLRSPRFLRFFYYAAAILVIGLISYSMAIYLNVNKFNPLTTLIVPRGQHAELLLSDGTKVWVNAGSEFSYPSAFNGSNREVILKGEAFFSVKSDVKHPFIVRSNQMVIMAVGTEFDVSAYPLDHTIRIYLKKGKLHVFPTKQPKKQIILLPSQSAIYDVDSHKLESGTLPNPEGWEDGHVTVKMEQFSDVIHQLERVYSVNINIQNHQLDTIVLNGGFNSHDAIETVLNAMNIGHLFQYKRNGERIIIY